MAKHISIIFKNIGQVLFLSNHWSGFIITVALFIGDWKVGGMALLSSIIAYVLTPIFHYPIEEIEDGRAGVNSVLTGVALHLFLTPSWQSIVVTLLGVALTMPVGAAFRAMMNVFRLPMLTFPFVFVSWMFLFMSFQYDYVNANVNILPSSVEKISFSKEPIDILSTLFSSFSEVFLLNHAIVGILIIAAIFIATRKGAVLAMIGSAIGALFVFMLGGHHDQISAGLFGYNVILVVLALGYAFPTPKYTNINILAGIMLTCVVHAGLLTWLMPFGLPVFTLPFIVATWLLLLAHRTAERAA